MGNEIKITFKRKVATVRLTKNQWNYRMNGLIQYLANLCNHIVWEVSDLNRKTK